MAGLGMKPPGSIVTLRRAWWYGAEPKPGDYLLTRRGRAYLILEVRGKQLRCEVNPADPVFPEGCRIFNWVWAGRRSKRSQRSSPLLD